MEPSTKVISKPLSIQIEFDYPSKPSVESKADYPDFRQIAKLVADANAFPPILPNQIVRASPNRRTRINCPLP